MAKTPTKSRKITRETRSIDSVFDDDDFAMGKKIKDIQFEIYKRGYQFEKMQERLGKLGATELKRMGAAVILDRQKFILSSKTFKEKTTHLELLDSVAKVQADLATEIDKAKLFQKEELPYAMELLDLKQQALQVETKLAYMNQFKAEDARRTGMKELEYMNVSLRHSINGLSLAQETKTVLEKKNEIAERGVEIFGVSLDQVKDMGKSIEKLMMNPWLILIGLFAMAVAKFKSLGAEAEDFRKETGFTKDQMDAIGQSARNVSTEMVAVGISSEGVYDAAKNLANTWGNIDLATKKNLETVAKLNVNWGVTANTGAAFVGTLKLMGDGTDAMAEDMANMTLNLAKGNGVSAAATMKDIAEMSGDTIAFFGKYPEKLVQAAVRARQLGTSINDMAAGAEKLLDWEQSINDEMEASILSGKLINLDLARQKAFMGDIAGARDEVLTQVGSIGELDNMNYITLKKVAEAAGLSVPELRKQLILKTAHAKLNKENLSSQEKTALNEEQMQNDLTKMSYSWNAITNSLSKIFLPVLEVIVPLLTGLMWPVTALSKVIDSITDSSKEWYIQLAKVAVTIASIWGIYKLIILASKLGAATKLAAGAGGIGGKMFGGLGGMFGKLKIGSGLSGKMGGGLGGMFNNMFGDIKGMTKGAAGLAMMAGAIYLLGKAMTVYQGLEWNTIAKAGVTMGSFTLIMKAMSASLTNMAAGALGLTLMSGAMYLFGKAMEPFQKMSWESLAIAATALVGFSAAVFGLGALMFTGAGAALFATGIIAIVALGGAMSALGIGLSLVAISGDAAANALKRLTEIDITKLASLGVAMGTLGVGAMIAAPAVAILGGAGLLGSKESTATATTTKRDKLDDVISGLEKIHERLGKLELVVNLDGRKVGKGLAIATAYGT